MRRNRIVLFRRIMMIAVMIVIFFFSRQSGSASRAISRMVAGLLGIKPSAGMTDIDTVPLMMGLNIRKYGHIFIFLLMGFFTFFSVDRKRGLPLQLIFGIGFSYIYACLDEIHQMFVDGRAGMFSDTLIDLGGIIAGVLLALLIQTVINRKKT